MSADNGAMAINQAIIADKLSIQVESLGEEMLIRELFELISSKGLKEVVETLKQC